MDGRHHAAEYVDSGNQSNQVKACKKSRTNWSSMWKVKNHPKRIWQMEWNALRRGPTQEHIRKRRRAFLETKEAPFNRAKKHPALNNE
ncbi:hypothetical protein SeLEV6574_g03695 [Synchytrium endobioticum]|uniref:Uncharacterized protein n=1 Tax=Synchytrium endobioticum TaxID=286115 RepID=A0A507D3E2_9FUNG|nr:hypothetical protein SeLEV6574_g03695 [Synchytrium endobioticum]